MWEEGQTLIAKGKKLMYVHDKMKNNLHLEAQMSNMLNSHVLDNSKPLETMMKRYLNSTTPISDDVMNMLEKFAANMEDVSVDNDAENKTKILKLVNIMRSVAKKMIEDSVLMQMMQKGMRKMGHHQQTRPNYNSWNNKDGGWGHGTGGGGYNGGNNWDDDNDFPHRPLPRPWGNDDEEGSGEWDYDIWENGMGGSGYNPGMWNDTNGFSPPPPPPGQSGGRPGGSQGEFGGQQGGRPGGQQGGRPGGQQGGRPGGQQGEFGGQQGGKGGQQGGFGGQQGGKGGQQGGKGNQQGGKGGFGGQNGEFGGQQGEKEEEFFFGGKPGGKEGSEFSGSTEFGSAGGDKRFPPAKLMTALEKENFEGVKSAIENAEPKDLIMAMNHNGGHAMSTLEKRFTETELEVLMATVHKKLNGKEKPEKENGEKNPFNFDDISLDALDLDDLDDMDEDMLDALLDEMTDMDDDGDEFSIWGSEAAWSRKKRSARRDDMKNEIKERMMQNKKKGRKEHMSFRLKKFMMMDKDRKAPPAMRDLSRFVKELIFTQDEEPTSMIGSRLSSSFRAEMREVMMLFLNEDMPMGVLDATKMMFKKLGKGIGQKMKGMLPFTQDMIKEIMDELNVPIKNKTLSDDPEVKRQWSWVAGIHNAIDDDVQALMASVLARIQGIT